MKLLRGLGLLLIGSAIISCDSPVADTENYSDSRSSEASRTLTLNNFYIGLQASDDGSAGAHSGTERLTNTAGSLEVEKWTEWATDDNGIIPDAWRIYLGTLLSG